MAQIRRVIECVTQAANETTHHVCHWPLFAATPTPNIDLLFMLTFATNSRFSRFQVFNIHLDGCSPPYTMPQPVEAKRIM
jgi:hypothetical protein